MGNQTHNFLMYKDFKKWLNFSKIGEEQILKIKNIGMSIIRDHCEVTRKSDRIVCTVSVAVPGQCWKILQTVIVIKAFAAV